MRGDALASGERSASFSVAPGLKFDEAVMRDDLTKLPQIAFMDKYLVTLREYDMLCNASDEKINSFAEEMKTRGQLWDREIELDEKQIASLNRECFLTPFVPHGLTGRIIVSQDTPAKRRDSRIVAPPRSKRTERELLPTTGHIIRAVVINEAGEDRGDTFIGQRVLFNPMSGSGICFKGYPTWRQLELTEILAIVHREDVQLVDEVLEPMI